MNLEDQLNDLADLAQLSNIAKALAHQMLETDDMEEVLKLTLQAFIDTEKLRLSKEAKPRSIILHHTEA